MRKIIVIILVMVIAVTGLLVSMPHWSMAALNWGLVSTLLLLLILSLLMWYIGSRPLNTLVISVTATMAALASLGRIVFVPAANIQPATFIILLSGYVFGSSTGLVVGMLTGLVSNFFLGHGPWTPWQMISWGMCGLLGGWLGKGTQKFNMVPFLSVSVIAAYLFGIFMNTWHWLNLVYPLTWQTLLATYGASLLFDTFHAVGNIVFAIILGPSFYYHLMRFRRRFPQLMDSKEATSKNA